MDAFTRGEKMPPTTEYDHNAHQPELLQIMRTALWTYLEIIFHICTNWLMKGISL